MGKSTPKNEVAVRENTTAVAMPDYLKGYQGPSGTEDIKSEDLTLPRLKIGQGLSPEVREGAVSYGDLFLNITGDVIAPAGEELPFVVLARSKEYILWRPQEDNGGGVLARAKPVVVDGVTRYQWDQPNTAFDVKLKGLLPVTWKTGEYVDEDGLGDWGSENPADPKSGIAATAHHNYVVILPTKGGLIVALSLSRTATKRAKDFNAMLKMGSAPLQARIFTVNTVDDKKDTYEFKNYKFKNAGFVQDALEFEHYKDIAESFKGRVINVDHSDGNEAGATDDRA